MNYEIVAIDLDDSLLNKDTKISNVNKNAIKLAQEKGTLITIATGRMLDSALPYIRELDINTAVIAYQGAYIKDLKTNEILSKKVVDISLAKEIIKQCKKDNLYVQAFIDGELYFEEDNEFSKVYEKRIGVKGKAVGNLTTFLHEGPMKLLMIDEAPRIKALSKEYQALFGEQVQVVISKPDFLEITHISATKGQALRLLAKVYNIPREKIIAIGDSYNDLSMINYAGLGVAMGNAPQGVKEQANYVTKSNDEDGVAEVIRRFILKGGQ